MDSEILPSENREVGEQSQGYPRSPSPTDPRSHRCLFVMDFSCPWSSGDVSAPVPELWGWRLLSC